jgi:heme/copper-type cytochrome/quinol oxidase subunit 2
MLTLVFIVLLAICILLFNYLVKRSEKVDYADEDPKFIIGVIFEVIFVLATIATLIGLIITSVSLANTRVLEEKISFYRENNVEIETRLENAVSAYLSHESQTYNNIIEAAGGDLTAILIVLPELQSSQHITKLLEVYENNNEIIRGLELRKINISLQRWWLYFGR